MRKQDLHPRTEAINKKQKQKSKTAKNEALQWLAARFPQAFDNRLNIQPLKSGVMPEILQYAEEAAAAGISKSKLREAVVIFTRRIDYLTTIKAKENRIDLSGEVVGSVTEEEAERASQKIKKRVEKSAKIARQCVVKGPTTFVQKSAASYNPQEESFSYSPAPKATSVLVKSKPSRQFDPDAVARLKEKLGLSRGEKETIK